MERPFTKQQAITILFLLWWITLPIGSFLLAIDLGPIVIYPNLILSVIIGAFGLPTFIRWSKWLLGIGVFLLLWLFLAGFQLISLPKTSLALFDFRSVLFQLVTYFVIGTSYFILGSKQFFHLCVQGIRFFLIVLLVSGVFESFTGIHPISTFTDVLATLSVSDIHYAPLFFYGNPNDFVAHYLFFLVLLLLLDKDWSRQPFLMLLFFVIAYHFSELADSSFGKIASCVLIVFYLVQQVVSSNWKLASKIFAGASAIVIALFLMNPLYIGPKYKDGANYRLNGVLNITKDSTGYHVSEVAKLYSKDEQKAIIHTLDSLEQTNPNRSSNLRQSLTLNGIEFIKENPIFGIGPGQFYQRHIDKKVPNYTHTVSNPHNFILEIIAGYGLIGWAYLIVVGTLFLQLFRQAKIGFMNRLKIVVSVLVLAVIWLMPSGFIYLEIHRLLLPLLLLIVLNKEERAV